MAEPLPQWRLYYEDWSIYDGRPADAPPLGVQCIVQWDIHHQRHILDRFDYWWYEGEQWYGGDLFGMFDYLMRRGLVKFGRTIPYHQFTAILEQAQNDPDFASPHSNISHNMRRLES